MVCFRYCTKLTGIQTERCSWTCCQDQDWLKQWCQRNISWIGQLINASEFTEKTKMAFFESCIWYLSNFITLETFKNLLSAFLSSKSHYTFVLNYRYKQLQCCQVNWFRLRSKFLKKCQKCNFYVFQEGIIFSSVRARNVQKYRICGSFTRRKSRIRVRVRDRRWMIRWLEPLTWCHYKLSNYVLSNFRICCLNA